MKTKEAIEATLESVQHALKQWTLDTTSPAELRDKQIEECKREIDYLQNELRKLKGN